MVYGICAEVGSHGTKGAFPGNQGPRILGRDFECGGSGKAPLYRGDGYGYSRPWW